MKSRNFLALAALLATLSTASPVGATESSADKKENSLTTITYNISNSLSTQGNSSKNTITYSTSLPNPAEPEEKNWLNENITVVLGIGGLILSIFSFAVKYHFDQEWKVREFTTKEFKEFEEAPETISVKKMLNSKSQLIDLFPTATHASNRFIYVDDEMLNDALITFDNNKQQELEYNNNLKEAQKRYQEKAKSDDK